MNASYTLSDKDVNQVLSVLVTYTDKQNTTDEVQSNSTQDIQPKNDEPGGSLSSQVTMENLKKIKP